MTIDGSYERGVCSTNKSSTGFALLMFSFISSMAFLIWAISYGTLREAVPLDWFLGSAFSPSLTSWLWACPFAYLSWRYLLRLISLVNSWFWRVNSAMAATMDCMCWMDGGCTTGADWRSWWGLLEAFLLSWWPGLVAIDLVLTIQPFYCRKINCKIQLIGFPQTAPIDDVKKISRLNAPGFNGLILAWKAWKRKNTIKGDWGGPAKNPSMLKLVFSLNF